MNKLVDVSKLSMLINNGGAKFGKLSESSIAAWGRDVKEFIDLSGNAYIVSAHHINTDYEDGVDNIYELKEIMSNIWDRPEKGILGNFSRYELNIIKDIFNLGDVDVNTLSQVQQHLSAVIKFRLEKEQDQM